MGLHKIDATSPAATQLQDSRRGFISLAVLPPHTQDLTVKFNVQLSCIVISCVDTERLYVEHNHVASKLSFSH